MKNWLRWEWKTDPWAFLPLLVIVPLGLFFGFGLLLIAAAWLRELYWLFGGQ